jgi:hypothetical protein
MADKVKLVSGTRIYMDVRALLDDVLDITVNFPRLYKYSVGTRMQSLTVDLMQDVAAAYMNRDRESRIQYLVSFQTKFETLRTLMRIAGERKWIKGQGKRAHIIQLMDAIGKQSTAWKNSLIKISD